MRARTFRLECIECARAGNAKRSESGREEMASKRKALESSSSERREPVASPAFDRPAPPRGALNLSLGLAKKKPRDSRFAPRFGALEPPLPPLRCTHWRQCDVLRRLRRSGAPPGAQRPRRGRAPAAHWQRQRAGVPRRPPSQARASSLLLRARRRRLLPQTGTRSRAPRARKRSAWELRGAAASASRQRRGRMNRTTTPKKTPSPKMPQERASGAARAPSERPRRPWC